MTAEKVVESIVAPATLSLDHAETSSEDSSLGYDEKMSKKLVRKIDLHILPVLATLYLLSFLDRTNIGNARLANLEKDLKMTGLDYNVRC